ncbi:MAG: GUN4 domain-containing protein [Cyanobacteria bacterium P01_A01_bin.123]
MMNNENKQNQTNKIDSSSGRESIDELLALKEEMTGRIEEIIARIEQNYDRRLEEAILFLAGSGDGENLQDSIGFNESDSRFGHSLARQLQSGAMLTVKQAHAALQMMQKYSQTQLEPNGYSLPMAWEEISHQYRESKIEGDPPGLRMVLKRKEEHGTYIAVYFPGDGYFGEDFSEDETWYEGGDWEGFVLQVTEEVLAAAARRIEDGYAGYVDPDIEAVYYLWQEEQKAGIGPGQIAASFSSSATSSTIDELLALKAEMAGRFEESIARLEQNYDRRLENAILSLAGSGDARSQDDIGFNGSDSRFGHYLARRLQSDENLTLKQAEAALQMMQKYSQSQLEPNGYSLPTAWEEISHQYHERTIEGELPPLSVVLKTGEGFVLQTGEYCDTYITAYYPNETVYERLVEYSEDIWDWGTGYGMRESGGMNVLLDSAPRLMDAVAGHIDSYRCYVDPDIEAAYYLWEQEQQRMVSQREPVLPLYAAPPDALRLDAVPLESERGADYQELRELLQQQEWYSADQATARLIKDVCRTVEGSINAEAIKQLPCEDLRTLDRLWVAASGGKFGFSVQKKIWLDLGLTNLDVEDADLDKFGDAVGWGLRGRQIYYRKSAFDLSTAPNGYFPRWGGPYTVGWSWNFGRVIAATAFQKAEICNL